jgi:hypothetical protein
LTYYPEIGPGVKDPPKPLCHCIFNLRWLAFWMYNLFR